MKVEASAQHHCPRLSVTLQQCDFYLPACPPIFFYSSMD